MCLGGATRRPGTPAGFRRSMRMKARDTTPSGPRSPPGRLRPRDPTAFSETKGLDSRKRSVKESRRTQIAQTSEGTMNDRHPTHEMLEAFLNGSLSSHAARGVVAHL